MNFIKPALSAITQQLTIVLPSYNERKNIDFLLQGFLHADEQGVIKRVIYVDDDSPDGSAEYIKTISNYPFEVNCLHRVGRQGLSSAVVEGVMLADTPYVAVMDADGQHDPRDLTRMFNLATQENADFIIGSRFKNSTALENHTGIRHLISQNGNKLCNFILRRNLTDPLTGFFLFKRSIFLDAVKQMRPTGFKILLEFLYRIRKNNIQVLEYPIQFRTRHDGDSKLDSRVIIEFIDQVLGFLTKGLFPEKLFGFILVGATGLALHLFLLYEFLFYMSLSFTTSQALATLISMVSNFTLNNILTFRRNRLKGWHWVKGLIYFILVCSFGALSNVGAAGYLNNIGEVWWLAGFIGVIVGTIFNFTLSRFFIWKP
jgi:dolichol-phosphate mannosyltransferase